MPEAHCDTRGTCASDSKSASHCIKGVSRADPRVLTSFESAVILRRDSQTRKRRDPGADPTMKLEPEETEIKQHAADLGDGRSLPG